MKLMENGTGGTANGETNGSQKKKKKKNKYTNEEWEAWYKEHPKMTLEQNLRRQGHKNQLNLLSHLPP